MVPWSAKVKWRSGWRNIQRDRREEEEAFRAYWEDVKRQLPPVSPPVRPPALPLILPGSGEDATPWVCAPMVLQSERAFRLLVRRHGIWLCYTPMIMAIALVEAGGLHGCPAALELSRLCPEDRPVVAQLAGSDPEVLVAAARMLSPYVDGIDLNLGCPQACAVLGGYGAPFAAAQPERAVAVVKALASAELGVPVSVKMRLQGDSVDKTVDFARRLEGAGAAFLTVHGRQLHQRDHQGPADLHAIRAVREAVGIPVVCNGNVRTLSDAQRCLQFTGCEAVMSAVGLLRHPRLFAANRGEEKDGAEGTESTMGLLGSSGVVMDVREALSCAWEYLDLAELHPPPEPRAIRDHLQAMLQGVLQWGDSGDVWALLGNDRLAAPSQFRDLLRLAASRAGEDVLSELGGWPGGQARTLKQIKTALLVRDDEEEEDGCLEGMAGLWGGGPSWEEDNEPGDDGFW